MKNIYAIVLTMSLCYQIQAQTPFRTCGIANQDQNALSQPDNSENAINNWLLQHPEGQSAQTVVYIPVIFHIIYSTSQAIVPVQRIYEQLNVMNEDFGGYNADYVNTPSVWQPISGNTNIQFCLAHTDPQNNWTDGYEYIQMSTPCDFGNVFQTVPSWDPNNYLNIWVIQCNDGTYAFQASLFGEDGVAVTHRYFGKTGAQAPYNLGRTVTHEIGHWLSLQHTWGNDNGCNGSDQVSDTPNQAVSSVGSCPGIGTVITDACSSTAPGIMWMNFMDYTDDACMYMFTSGQAARMWAALNTTHQGLLTSTKCQITGTQEGVISGSPLLYPSPTQGFFTIELPENYAAIKQISIYTLTGQSMFSSNAPSTINNRIELDISALAAGLYLVEIETVTGKAMLRVTRN